jgi:uncharacterized protein (DUF1330 family)
MLTAAPMPASGEPEFDPEARRIMPFEMTVALFVADHEKYAAYRAEIAPLLEATGGRFRYDVDVSRNRTSEAHHDINRLFVIQFPDRARKESFFSNSQYREIRDRLFVKAVEGVTIIAEYVT